MEKILTCAQMRAADGYTMRERGISSRTLMERAGEAIADAAAAAMQGRTGKILAVCGGGNNGGDGWCAARLLAARGFSVAVWDAAEHRSEDCEEQRSLYLAAGLPAYGFAPAGEFALVIEALFGTGFHGAPAGRAAEAVAFVNKCGQAGAFVLAADIPAGLDGDTGLAQGDAVRASLTVTVGERKWGLYLNDGADLCGRIERADIDIDLPAPAYGVRFSPADLACLFPPKRRNSHKGSYGRAVILAGSLRYTGAGLLAAGAALRAGAGYTALHCPESVFGFYAGKFPELLLGSLPEEEGCFRLDEEALSAACAGADAVAFGMGCGCTRGVYDCAVWLLENYGGTLVLDADALNALAAYGTGPLKKRRAHVILTPHPAELARLCGKTVREVQEGGPAFARSFAAEYGVTLLLKGCASVVAGGPRLALVAEGGPELARGGSGDVLSGLVCGLAARGAAPYMAAVGGAHLLGRAGAVAKERAGNEYTVTASDVIAAIPAAVAELAGA